MAGGTPREITSGSGVETNPQVLGGGELLAYRAADARRPQGVTLAHLPPAGAGTPPHPAVVFMHGGPIRQMLPAWHYLEY